MRDIYIAITAASYSGNKGAAAMLQSSIKALYGIYGDKLHIKLMSVYPAEDKKQIPFDFIEVVPAPPERLLFVAFPLAVIYKLFGWIPFFKAVIGRNKIIRAYKKTDLVIDEAGISFVDSRGAIMNIYAFVCAAIPMLLGVPVVKYSQALGGFNSKINRFLSKWILPKVKLICARGEITRQNLASIGVTENVRLCADGAFTMPDDAHWTKKIESLCNSDSFYDENHKIIAVSISSVVENKCKTLRIDYTSIMVRFLNHLTETGYHVLIIANAARAGSSKPRNNDLIICEEVYRRSADKDRIRWYSEEMAPEQIRGLISRCDALVASRFHAMIAALEKEIPVFLIGWSHKYKEVLDMFGLGDCSINYAELSEDFLKNKFNEFIQDIDSIKHKIQANISAVKESSANNIKYISEIIDEIATKPNRKSLLDTNNPDKYIKEHIECRMGYAVSDDIRKICASGGTVTAILCHLLEAKQIDGAWVTKSCIVNGELSYKTFVATTRGEIEDCASSVYMYIPMMKHINEIMAFEGKIAVVMVPCQLRALNKLMQKRDDVRKKIVLRLGLYCSGSHDKGATLLPLEKAKISLVNAKRIIYRQGHWRGKTRVLYHDGSERAISYTKNICAYKNAYFFTRESCFVCQDHFAEYADISFGDIWLREMKKNPIKHTSCVIRTLAGRKAYQFAANCGGGVITDYHIGDDKIVMSQKRSLVFKYNCAKQKERIYAGAHNDIKLFCEDKCKWNHALAAILAYKNMKLSKDKYTLLQMVPKTLVYWYMLFIRALLSK